MKITNIKAQSSNEIQSPNDQNFWYWILVFELIIIFVYNK